MLGPFKLIPSACSVQISEETLTFVHIVDGVHHYDENGLGDMSQEPLDIRNIHEEIIVFVKNWLEDWHPVT